MTFSIRHELAADIPARETLLDKAFGIARLRKTSERLREGCVPAMGLSFSATSARGLVIGTVRLWPIIAGSAGPSLLLGPVAVDHRHQGKGIGAALMQHALACAQGKGHDSVLLVGDAPYYGRFGFSVAHTRNLHLPGPVERARFLGLELTPGALDGAEGLVSVAGLLKPAIAASLAA